MKFFNREKEINKILSIIEGEPNLIYFIYGSLNSGKFNLTEETQFIYSIVVTDGLFS
ncbi:hypothetical protein MJ_0821 [Methanocaldococcus jannaschii DSM 2661]|uniref:Putative uncharacterized protein MJ0821 n=2 Tax=Methanocaldococcus jannaschii TaxID=2190 RepID=Y821_METJA|nr:PUTATIVE PSEUDOGENE: RecName: Full=Putative uncharacterized protein MJ0821 [Methanocaldococcus jannaschii DSM 2661]AAB98833.1 hypothetical protein MJ_0821 [Methanocaldococcus jannaschii DSM 2661]